MISYQLTAAVTALANLLSDKLSNDELAILAVILVQPGDTLATILTLRTICEENKITQSEKE